MEQQRRAKADYERATRQRLDNLERRAFLEDHPDFALPDEAAHQRARAAHPSVVKEDPPS